MPIKKIIIFGILICIAFVFTFKSFTNSFIHAQTAQPVTVSVEPHPTDLQSSINSSISDRISQGTEVSYIITYGSNLFYPSPLTVEAEWTLGNVQGSGIADVETVDYIIGSASDGLSSTPAVVDLVNRKISWNFSSFPAKTKNKTVTFKLRTNDNYTGHKRVTFTVHARTKVGSIITSDNVSNIYQFDQTIDSPTPTPTSIPIPTTTPTPIPGNSTVTVTPIAITPTPTPKPNTPLTFKEVYISSLLSDMASFNVDLNHPAKIKVSYGKNIALGNNLHSLDNLAKQRIELNNLLPETIYYVSIIAVSPLGETTNSDIFTFKTPPTSQVPEPESNTLIITSNNVILASPTSLEEDKKITPSLAITKNSVYEFRFSIKNHESIKKIEATLRNKYILGFGFPLKAEASTQNTVLTEVSPGIFEGRLKAPDTTGNFEIALRIFDTKGNIAEKKIADLKIIKPLTVIRKGDSKVPVEGARVLINKYNPKINDYEILSPVSYSIENPSYTNAEGESNIALPAGKYMVSVNAIGYKPTEIKFSLTDKTGDDYPTIELATDFSILAFANYFWSSFMDFSNITKSYLLIIGSSNRFFELNAASTLLITFIIIFFGLSLHTKIPLNQLPSYVLHLVKLRSLKYRARIVSGKVLNFDNGLPENEVSIFLLDPMTDNIIFKIKTNKLGEFTFQKPSIDVFKLLLLKNDFEDVLVEKTTNENLSDLIINIKQKTNLKSFKGVLRELTELIMALIIPGLIVICLIVELALGYSFGWFKVIPFIIISIINCVLWAKFYKPVFKNL